MESYASFRKSDTSAWTSVGGERDVTRLIRASDNAQSARQELAILRALVSHIRTGQPDKRQAFALSELELEGLNTFLGLVLDQLKRVTEDLESLVGRD